jgi:hypothetical protein
VGRTSRPEYHRGKRRSPASTCSPLSQAIIQRDGAGGRSGKDISNGVRVGRGLVWQGNEPGGSVDGAKGGEANGGPGIAKFFLYLVDLKNYGVPAEAKPCGAPLGEKSGDKWGGGIGSCRVTGSRGCGVGGTGMDGWGGCCGS